MSGLTHNSPLRRPYFAGHRSSYLDLIPEEADEYRDISLEELEAYARLADIDAQTKPSLRRARSSSHRRNSTSTTTAAANSDNMTGELDQMAAAKEEDLKGHQSTDSSDDTAAAAPPRSHSLGLDVTATPGGSTVANDYLSASGSASGLSTPTTPGTSATNFEFGQDSFPPVDRLTMFDILENLALPQRLERMQNAIHDNAEKLRRQRQRLTSRALSSKDLVVEQWRKRTKSSSSFTGGQGGSSGDKSSSSSADARLERYRKRMRASVDRLSKRWNDAKSVTFMEKVSFVTATMNIFISAYLIGAYPEYFHYWYSLQLA